MYIMGLFSVQMRSCKWDRDYAHAHGKLGVACGQRRREGRDRRKYRSKMNSLGEKMKVVEGYCEVVLASEREKLPEIERLKQQMESFDQDRGTSEQFAALL